MKATLVLGILALVVTGCHSASLEHKRGVEEHKRDSSGSGGDSSGGDGGDGGMEATSVMPMTAPTIN